MKINKLNEDIQHCWFGYYMDKDGNKKYFYMTKDSTSTDPDEASEIMGDSIPEPYTKFVFQGSVANTQAEKQGWKLIECKSKLTEAWEKGDPVTLWWKDPNWHPTSPCYASCTYVGKTKDGMHKFTSDNYGWTYLLDMANGTITTPNGKTFDVHNESGWMHEDAHNIKLSPDDRMVQIDIEDKSEVGDDSHPIQRGLGGHSLSKFGGSLKGSKKLFESTEENWAVFATDRETGKEYCSGVYSSESYAHRAAAMDRAGDAEYGYGDFNYRVERVDEYTDELWRSYGELNSLKLANNKKLNESTGTNIKNIAGAISKAYADSSGSQKSRIASDVINAVPDDAADDLVDAFKKCAGNIKLRKEDKDRIADKAGVDSKLLDKCGNVASVLDALISGDILTNNPKLCKTVILTVIGIIAIIEPTPIGEAIATIIVMMPAEWIAKILDILSYLNLPQAIYKIGRKIIRDRRAKEANSSDDLEEDINDPDEVLDFKRDVEAAESIDDIQWLIYGLSDGVAEDNCQQAFNANESKSLVDVKEEVIAALDVYLEDNEWLGESKKMNEASYGNQDCPYEVHWVSPDGNDKLLGASKTVEGAAKIAINQMNQIFESPFENIKRKTHFISELYIVNATNGDDVTTEEVENHQNNLINKLRGGLNEASYGGAYDIEDDQYFTREDIESAAEEVMGHITETFTEPYHLGGTWFENGEWIVNVQGEQFDEYEESIHIDMRKIRTPLHLKKVYTMDMAAKLIAQIKEYNGMNEWVSSSASRMDWDDDDEQTYFHDDEQLKSDYYTYVSSKSVPDSDGFMTDYTWYQHEDGTHVFVFGDNDIYGPEDGYFDHTCDSDAEAREWFDSYNGFEDADDDGDVFKLPESTEPLPSHQQLDEAWDPYDQTHGWNADDIELHKSIDWGARNYTEYPVPEDSFNGKAYVYGVGKSRIDADVKFIKYIRPNPIFPPYYAPEANPFKDGEFTSVVGPMYDGHMHGGYQIHDRYETQEVYDQLSEKVENWHDVYKKFLDIVETSYHGEPGDEERMNSMVDDLYNQHKGEYAWDLAYSRWHEDDDCYDAEGNSLY